MWDFRVRDECGNKVDVKDVQMCDLIGGGKQVTIILKNRKSELFSDGDIKLIMELLHGALEYGGSYLKMSRVVDLMDKLNEENGLNR